MPLDKLVLILVCVIAAVGATLWLAMLVMATFAVPIAGLGLIPAVLAGYIAYRVIGQRVGNRTEDHYDDMEN
jgi:hypothetical protein